jgi:hypothetical protein
MQHYLNIADEKTETLKTRRVKLIYEAGEDSTD